MQKRAEEEVEGKILAEQKLRETLPRLRHYITPLGKRGGREEWKREGRGLGRRRAETHNPCEIHERKGVEEKSGRGLGLGVWSHGQLNRELVNLGEGWLDALSRVPASTLERESARALARESGWRRE